MTPKLLSEAEIEDIKVSNKIGYGLNSDVVNKLLAHIAAQAEQIAELKKLLDDKKMTWRNLRNG